MTVSSPSLPTLFSMLTVYESYFHVLVLRKNKWIRNSRNVLETTPELERSKDIKKINARKDE